jgi:hypothetical protein
VLVLCPNERLQMLDHFYFASCYELALEDAEDLGKHEGMQDTQKVSIESCKEAV